MKKSTQKSLMGFALTVAGVIVAKVAWTWFSGDKKVQDAKAKSQAA